MDRKHMRDAMRLVDVKRWNMVRTTRDQSVIEHSAAVSLIAARLATMLEMDPAQAAYWGLLHDIDESTTGDIPSHVKRAVMRNGFDMNTMTDFGGVPEPYRALIKLADKIEGCFWLREYRHGSHANWVLEDIEKALGKALDACDAPTRAAALAVIQELNADTRPDFSLSKTHVVDHS